MHARLVTAFAVVVGSITLVACASVEDDPNYASRILRRDSGVADSRTDTATDTSSDTESVEDTGTEDTGTEDTGRLADTGAYDAGSGDPCNDCVGSSCSTELTTCLTDTACNAQMDCLSKCFDSACADKCAVDYPSTKVSPLMSCVSAKCYVPCSGP